MGSVTLNKQIYAKVKEEADKQNRSIANLLETLFIEKYDGEQNNG